MSNAGAMRSFDPYMGKEEYIYLKKDNENHSDQRMETGPDVRKAFLELVQKKKEELKERIQNGTSEPSYQIGGSSFTEREWTKLIQSVDKAQEEMRKEAERERELQEKMEEAEQTEKTDSCIIVYDADGIRCIEAESGVCRWFIKFTDNTQYFKVQEFMEEVEGGDSFAPAFEQGFWNALLGV